MSTTGVAPVSDAGRQAGGGTGGATGPGGAHKRGRRRPIGVWVVGALALLFLAFGAAGGPYQGRLSEVQKNDNSAFLPATAESTRVANASAAFSPVQTIPGVVVYQRLPALTAADRTFLGAAPATLRGRDGVAADQVGPAQFSADGTTAAVTVPLVASDNGVDVPGDRLVTREKAVLAAARDGAPAGLAVHSAGPGGLLVAFIDSFAGLDGVLLLAAGGVVILILLVVYRSPVLWFFPLFCAALGLGGAALVVYVLADRGTITLNGQSQGILSVLVLGAGTDYALLMVSRYREELHAHESRLDAMVAAWKGAAPPIAASALTVIVSLMCLTLGELNSNKSLGPVCAIGIAVTVAVMLTVLPAMLLVGRWIFWPRIPHPDHRVAAAGLPGRGAWGRFAAALGRHARRSWILATVVLLACVAAIGGLRTSGLSTVDSLTNNPDAVVGERIYEAKFDAGAGSPAAILTAAGRAPAVIAAASRVEGVARTPGAVCIQTDYVALAKAAAARGGTGGAPGGGPPAGAPGGGPPAGAPGGGPPAGAPGGAGGCPPAQFQVRPVDGRLLVSAQLTAAYDTQPAYDTVARLRAAVHAVDGADALVGGQAAINADTNDASRHDRDLVIPIVLAVIVGVLGLLLRSVVAPLLLVATVVLSFAATLGVCALVFNHVLHFANADPGFPLFAFIFLVALGIDYNIFLMTRVREEAVRHGTREGTLRGLAVTGGVITSAGVVLAATFAVLGVLPVVFLAEIGFAVAFGVLLDTLLVRSVLVPALAHDIGRVIWWPSRLARGAP